LYASEINVRYRLLNDSVNHEPHEPVLGQGLGFLSGLICAMYHGTHGIMDAVNMSAPIQGCNSICIVDARKEMFCPIDIQDRGTFRSLASSDQSSVQRCGCFKQYADCPQVCD
jgi:hypothetical protein